MEPYRSTRQQSIKVDLAGADIGTNLSYDHGQVRFTLGMGSFSCYSLLRDTILMPRNPSTKL